jgi:protein PhnA
VVKNIRLTDDEDAIEGKVEGSVIVIKTCYLKKK